MLDNAINIFYNSKQYLLEKGVFAGMNAVAYLQFDGSAKEAIEFYEKALNADKVMFLTFGQMPNLDLSPEEKNMIMDAYIEFSGNVLMLSDVLPSMQKTVGKVLRGNNVLISLIGADDKSNKEWFANLSKGGQAIMPISSVPWSRSFGMLVDRFGVTWKFNSDARDFIDGFDAK